MLDDSKKALESEHDSMQEQLKSELAALKKKALSSI